jgi:ATP-dependent DNA helicase RecG
MKSSPSNTSKEVAWNSSIHSLFRGGKSKIADQLLNHDLSTLEDLLWVLPLRLQLIPPVRSFAEAREGEFFRGVGKIMSHQTRPNFHAKGKGRALLQNITISVQDVHSKEFLQLRWFNAYSSINHKIKAHDIISFMGIIQVFNGTMQIVNPDFDKFDPEFNPPLQLRPLYPTVNKVSPVQLQQVMRKIPLSLWNKIEDPLPYSVREKHGLLTLGESFRTLHGIFPAEEFSHEKIEQAQNRLIYEDFFNDQIKIFLRRDKIQRPVAEPINILPSHFEEAHHLFNFEFTPDQKLALSDIADDLKKNHPMMRLVQGDVGCGKTAVAMSAAYLVIRAGRQVAIMCPTEALAYQHYDNARNVLNKDISVALLIGSLKPSSKTKIKDELKHGKIQLIIGTHALIQDSVEFKNLALAIIDEQHKFGVEQRLKLTRNNKGAHCLIMTATPIPRSLSLTQYGDLDITTIKTMPTGRRGHRTRIITTETMEKYLSFLKTRLSLGEQAYIVVPAIEESPSLDIHNLNDVLELYCRLYCDYRCAGLHGQMSPEEKHSTLQQFKEGHIQILVATSVIEVGIDIPNATVLSIINPERFGLSSLHQLRGRVGRGDKPGFCFLVAAQELSQEAMDRLRVIELHTDGFKISEEDLRIRGEGDLFGRDQSGEHRHRRLTNILLHQPMLLNAREDVTYLWDNDPALLGPYIRRWEHDEKIFSTI